MNSMFKLVSVMVTVALLAAFAAVPGAAQSDEPPFPVTIDHKFGSTTISEAPQRVVAIGYTEQDFLLAVGVTPVAVRYWYGDENDAIFPWAEDKVEAESPVVLNMPFGGLDYEAILALDPDLISAVAAGITQEEYDMLSQIAPTIAQTDDYIDFGMPWQDVMLMIGAAVGKRAEAESIVADVEALFAGARAQNPAFEGKTVAVAYYYDGTYGFYTDQDSRGRFFTDLGFVMPDELMDVAGDSFYVDLSAERVDLLDQDLIAIVNLQFIEGGREALEAEPLFGGLDAVQDGRVVYLDEQTENALGFSSPLSLAYALDAVPPQLEAIFGEPTTTAACDEGLSPIEDAAGQSMCIPADPQRIVGLMEADVDALLALGITPVGATNGRGQSMPPRYLDEYLGDVTSVGTFYSPNLEILLELDPDLILFGGFTDEAVLEQLNAIAPTVNTFQTGEPWQSHFLRVAEILDRTGEAHAFIDDYEARVAEIQSELGDKRGRYVHRRAMERRWAADHGPHTHIFERRAAGPGPDRRAEDSRTPGRAPAFRAAEPGVARTAGCGLGVHRHAESRRRRRRRAGSCARKPAVPVVGRGAKRSRRHGRWLAVDQRRRAAGRDDGARRCGCGPGGRRVTMLSAQTQVTTERAGRYLKALCNHFNRKVTAEYDGDRGNVQFSFATCQMNVEGDSLVIRVQAEKADDFARVKYVVADHLERFAANYEAFQVHWVDQA